MGDGGANLWRGVCGEALYRTAWLICSRRYYIAPDMLSFRNVDAIISFHMMLDRDR